MQEQRSKDGKKNLNFLNLGKIQINLNHGQTPKNSPRENPQAKDELSITEHTQELLRQYPNSSMIARRNSFDSFLETFGHRTPSDLTTNEYRLWFSEIKERNNYSDKTLNRIKSNINALFRFLEEKEIIKGSPLLKIKFKENCPARRKRVFFSENEIKDILLKAKKFNPNIFYPFLYAIAQTGTRRSEMMNLEWADVDFNTGFIALRETKNGETRLIKMSPKLEELLKEKFIQRKSAYVFPNEFGERLNRMKVQRMMIAFKRFFPTSKDWNYHALRHSFAYNFLKKGGEMYKLKAILGHKTIAMTVDLYGELKAEDVENPSPYSF